MENATVSKEKKLTELSPVEKVLYVWDNLWSHPYDLDFIDELMHEDFVIENAGKEIKGRENFKAWAREFHRVFPDSKMYSLDHFESKDGTKVVSRWKLIGTHNGMWGIEPTGEQMEILGIAIWEIKDNRLVRNTVERNSFELFQTLVS